jgi:hypothetical protein
MCDRSHLANRHERRIEQRALRKLKAAMQEGRLINVSIGHLLAGDPNYGTPVLCAVCSAPHKALGLAQIEDRSGASLVPLCEACVTAGDATTDAITRKYWGAPDLVINRGGKLGERFIAMEEKLNATEH